MKDRTMKTRKLSSFLGLFSLISVSCYLFIVTQDGQSDRLKGETLNQIRTTFQNGGKFQVDSTIEVITAFSEELEPHVKSQTCSVGPIEHITWDNKQWQRVEYKNVYLISAFYDSRYQFRGKSYHFVRLISLIRDTLETDLTCYLWTSESNKTATTVPVHSVELWLDIWGKGSSVTLYKSYLLSCFIPESIRNKVTGVSLSSKACSKPETYLPVEPKDRPLEPSQRKDFLVCVKALDFAKDISLRLVEWIELQFILGADVIDIYVYRVHPRTRKVLQYYQALGRVQIIDLQLPGQLRNDPEERSQFMKNNIWQKRRLELIPYNECLYRHLYTHRFMVLVDIDEAIIPVQDETWNQLLQRIFTNDPKALHEYPSFSAQNTYFFDTYPVPADPSIPSHLYMLSHTGRSVNFSIPGFAVKSFISINTSLAVFNHYTMFPLYGSMKRNALISKSLAQLNHYKAACPRTMARECAVRFMKHWTVDKILWKYKEPLIEQVNKVVTKLKL